MKIKVDKHLPASIAHDLVRLGHDAETVAEEGLAGIGDAGLWREVVREGRFLITQDVKFADARRTAAPGSPGVLLLRMGDVEMVDVAARVKALFETEDVDLWRGCSVKATLLKLRVRSLRKRK